MALVEAVAGDAVAWNPVANDIAEDVVAGEAVAEEAEEAGDLGETNAYGIGLLVDIGATDGCNACSDRWETASRVKRGTKEKPSCSSSVLMLIDENGA